MCKHASKARKTSTYVRKTFAYIRHIRQVDTCSYAHMYKRCACTHKTRADEHKSYAYPTACGKPATVHLGWLVGLIG